jgi:type I restriction enzyme S subunit
MKNWERKKIVEISTFFEDGDWIESKDQSDQGMRLIQTGNVGNGFFKSRGEKARYISKETYERLRCTEIFKGDCLVSRLPDPVGRACILPDIGEKMITAVDCTIIRFDENRIIPNWFLYYSLSNEYQNEIQKQVTGATRQRISRKYLGLVYVPLPPLPEQQRIVSILDKAFAAIAKAKANAERCLRLSKALFESYLQGVFEKKGEGWEEITLGEVCSLITDGKHGDCDNENNSGYYFLSAKDVRNDTLLYENARQITKVGFEETHRRTNLKPGDICMVNTGATIGRMSLAPDDPKTYRTTFQKSVAVIKTIPKLINNEFCCYLLKSDLKKLVKTSGGTAVPNLLLGDLKKHRINIPKSLSEQQTIVACLDTISYETKKLEAIYQKKLVDLEELKKSILQKAFSGEL